jgi:DNA repair exonuclease SbcCD ATPase subunit
VSKTGHPKTVLFANGFMIMKHTSISLTAILLLLTATAANSQSLADLAKKEQERRAKIKAENKVITNDDAGKYKSGAVTTGTIPAQPASEKVGSTDASIKEAKANSDEPVDIQGRPEGFWRQTMADARKQVKDLENQTDVLVLKLNDLQNQFYREASGFRQQDIQKEIQKTLNEQEQTKDKLSKAKEQLQNLENEARKSGALPGWLTP